VTGASRNACQYQADAAESRDGGEPRRGCSRRGTSASRHFHVGGRSHPRGGRLRVRSMSVCNSVLPSLETATFARSLVRVVRSSWSMSPLPGFSSQRARTLRGHHRTCRDSRGDVLLAK